jgi:hypothetical protein
LSVRKTKTEEPSSASRGEPAENFSLDNKSSYSRARRSFN